MSDPLAGYGGGPMLPRNVIISGLSQTELTVEVYSLWLQLHVLPKSDHSIIRISKKVPIWDYYGHRKRALMNDIDKTLDDANLQMDQDILVEVNNTNSTTFSQENGYAQREASSVLVEPPKSSLSIAGGLSAKKGASKSYNVELSSSQNVNSAVKDVEHPFGTSGVTTRGSFGGLTGLLNLGNICFMNSAIQCLVHTPEFATKSLSHLILSCTFRCHFSRLIIGP